jgi:uncharacterized repeat protein (TIGR01451 family)
MSRSAAKIALLAGSLAMVAGGCTTPSAETAGPSWMPGGNIPNMPGSGSIPSTPGYSSAAPPPQLAADESAIAQVGFFTPAQAPADCCGDRFISGPAAAQGYLSQSAAGWNAHGLDPQEFICDGGDQPPRALLRRDDSIAGLDPEDTVVHYTTENGDIELQASNRACLYSPRFISVRKMTGALAGGRAIGLRQLDRPEGAGRFESQQPGLVMSETVELAHAEVARRIDAMRERIRGVPVEGVLQPEMAGDVMAALAGLTVTEMSELRDNEKALLQELAEAAVTWSLDEALVVAIEDLKAPTLTRSEHLEGFTIYDFPAAGRLRIGKLADREHALPGETVSFVIRVENVGDSAVDHVVLVDNLTTRLEYVEGSQTCSGGAEFEATANVGQSLKLQWTLTDKLRVGESVSIRFQCKVR